jgi:hypothetical protein
MRQIKASLTLLCLSAITLTISHMMHVLRNSRFSIINPGLKNYVQRYPVRLFLGMFANTLCYHHELSKFPKLVE